MHPLIRILCLILMAAALPALPLLDLCALFLLSLLGFLRWAPHAMARLRMGVYRLRWLLLAIGILYMGFTPGEPLHAWLPGLSREGILEGARRMLVLIDLLALVYLMLALTPTSELAAAVRQLLTPMSIFGLDTDRFGRRLALVLEGVGEAQQRLEAARGREKLVDALVSVLHELETDATREPAQAALPVLGAPRWWQWLLPLLLAFVLWMWPR